MSALNRHISTDIDIYNVIIFSSLVCSMLPVYCRISFTVYNVQMSVAVSTSLEDRVFFVCALKPRSARTGRTVF